MANQHKYSEAFIYIQQKTKELGSLILYREFRGLGTEPMKEATEVAAEIIARGERCVITTAYAGGEMVL